MIKKQHAWILGLLALFAPTAWCGTSYMAGDRVAVFEPNGYDPADTQPSLIFISALTNSGAVPADWDVQPVFSTVAGDAVATITVAGDVDLYGNGEVTGPLRRNGTQVTLWNTDNYAYGKHNGSRLYQSHPWVMGVRPDGSAFGIIADNTWKQYFDLTGPITITSEGPAYRVIIIERDNPMELQEALAELTGKMPLPPLWALGFQQCRYSYYPESRVREIVDNFRIRSIPCDVVWMDIDYMDGYRIFTFDSSGFPDPAGLNAYIHTNDFKAIYMINPGVKAEAGYFVYDEGSAGDHWVQTASGFEYNGEVWPGNSAFPDFTRPETRAWWATLYDDFMAQGIDGVWNDMNEPAVFNTPDWTMPESNHHRGGGDLPAGPHLRYHNLYGMLMVKASREGILDANPAKRPFVLSRANFLGGHRYAATWTGDNQSTWEHMKLSIPMSLSLSLSGQPFNGPDIGGFAGSCYAELLGHWMALGAYYPFSRNHTAVGTVDQEPWAFGQAIEDVSRTALNRRYRLMPYLYTLFQEASDKGAPIMRPTFFADPADPDLRDDEETFLLGGDLWIVPRWASDFDLVSGDWDLVRMEDTDDGYQPFVFLRPGAIVPMGPVIQSTEDYTTERITLLVNPAADGSASGMLYHDAGDGFGYQSGDYAIHEFAASFESAGLLRIDITQTEGFFDITREYRIGFVSDDDVIYTDWSTNLIQYATVVADRVTSVDTSLFPGFDSDGDYLSDTDEVYTHSTDPQDPDSDNDSVNDATEVYCGSDPNSGASLPVITVPAEVIGAEFFDYYDGGISGLYGGEMFDVDNNVSNDLYVGHTCNPSEWYSLSTEAAADRFTLRTSGGSHGFRTLNGAQTGGTELGVFSGDPLTGSTSSNLYFKVDITPENDHYAGLSLYRDGSEKLFFGITSAGVWGLDEAGYGASNTGLSPISGTAYTLVGKVDVSSGLATVWIDPDLLSGENSATPAVTRSLSGDVTYNAIRLESGGAGSVYWDDLVIAYTWGGLAYDGADTDADLLRDTWELLYAADLATIAPGADADGDGLDDELEQLWMTHPLNEDSDGDGYGDGEEIDAGTDPLNAADRPGPLVTVVVDGVLETDLYGAPIVTQSINAAWGDGWSELNAAYALVDDGRLYLMLAGNVSPDWNKIEIFIDSTDAVKTNVLNAVGNDNGNVMDGLQFDAGFEPDYHLHFRRGNSSAHLDIADLGAQTYSSYTSLFPGEGSATTGSGTANASAIQVAYLDSNTGGVVGGTGVAAADHWTNSLHGLEISIDLADLGSPSGIIRACVMINGYNRDFLSNQMLAGLPAGTDALGSDMSGGFDGNLDDINLNTLAGDQYFEIDLGIPVGPHSFTGIALLSEGSGLQLGLSNLTIGVDYAIQSSTNLQTGFFDVPGAAFTATSEVQTIIMPATNDVLFLRGRTMP